MMCQGKSRARVFTALFRLSSNLRASSIINGQAHWATPGVFGGLLNFFSKFNVFYTDLDSSMLKK